MTASSPWGGTQEVTPQRNADRETELRQILARGAEGRAELERILNALWDRAEARGQAVKRESSGMIQEILQLELAERFGHIGFPKV